MSMFDYVVVGAGLSGVVMAERIASQLKKRVLIIERREHVGGNTYDYYNEDGILVSRYGPHVFHTKLKEIWDYLSQFTEWHHYQHKVLGHVDGNLVPIPFNLNSIKVLFPKPIAEKLSSKLVDFFGYGNKVHVLELKETKDEDLKFLADYVYDKVFLNFTHKQWGLRPEELDVSITGRVPIYISYDDRYFKDEFQGVPKFGYARMIKNMLNHNNIKLMLNTDYREVLTVNHLTKQIKLFGQPFEGKLIYTGKIDELFDFCFGELPYRGLELKFETVNREFYQDAGTIHFPNEYEFTRVSEMKRITGQKSDVTTIIREFPKDCNRNDIPYYPIPQKENIEKFNQYKEKAKEYSGIILTGRLADYKYYDMHASILIALDKFRSLLATNIN